MKDKLNVVKVANSLALTSAVIYLICIIAVWIAPNLTLAIGNYLLHGIDLSRIAVARSFGFSLITLISGTIAGWLAGALFALVYNKLK